LILYVNGDSHSAGAEAVNDYCFAEDDPFYSSLGRKPHPDNERVSYGCNVANDFFAILHCDAESASSNSRIIRTTREYLLNETPDLIIIGWSTWEREEWLYNGTYWQVNAGGVGHDWPLPIQKRYKDYIVNLNWKEKTRLAHKEINQFHHELLDLRIPHLFFNTFNDFQHIEQAIWHDSYVEPYNPNMTYYKWLSDCGFKAKPSYHYGPDAHRKWADFLLPYLTKLL